LLKCNFSEEEWGVASYLFVFFGNNEGTGTSQFTALAKKQYFQGKQRVAIRAFSYLVVFRMK